MSLLSELKDLATECGLPVETGVFSGTAPAAYLVLTPLSDTFDLFGDNTPEIDVQEVRLSLFTKSNYTEVKNVLVRLLLAADMTITDRRYIGHEDDTGYHNYAIDVAKPYEMEE